MAAPTTWSASPPTFKRPCSTLPGFLLIPNNSTSK
jgi:hypothetical protein